MNRTFIAVLSTLALAACSEDPAPSPDGAASSTSTSSSGSSGTDAGTSSSSGGADPAGTAVIEATLTKPTDGFAGSVEPFKGTAGKGTTDVKENSVLFTSVSDTSTLKRQVTVALGAVSPVEGKSYTIGTTGDDLFNGNKMLYEERAVSTDTGPSANCGGTLKFDSIAGKVYKFSFEGLCGAFSGGKGGFTIKGTGTGTAL